LNRNARVAIAANARVAIPIQRVASRKISGVGIVKRIRVNVIGTLLSKSSVSEPSMLTILTAEFSFL
jgi:hypothetical protein